MKLPRGYFLIFYTVSTMESAGMWMKPKREYCCAVYFEASVDVKSDEKFVIFPRKEG